MGASWIGSPSTEQLAAAGVDRDRAVRAAALRDGRRRGGAAQDRADAGDQLARVERLREVVVGADLEADDLVDVVVARRQHQDRHRARRAHVAADLEPVHVGQVEVEQDQRRARADGLLLRLRAVDGAVDRVAGLLEIGADEARDVGFVLDDEDALGHGLTLATRPVAPACGSAAGRDASWSAAAVTGRRRRRRRGRHRRAGHRELEELLDGLRHLAELDRAGRSSAICAPLTVSVPLPRTCRRP